MEVTCSRCKETKHSSEFSPSKNKYKRNGLSGECRICGRDRLRARRGWNGSDRRVKFNGHVNAYKAHKARQLKKVQSVARKAEDRAERARRFVESVAAVHDGKGYEVDALSFSGMNHHVKIKCPTHGWHTFSKARNVVHQGSGCPECSCKHIAAPHEVYLVTLKIEGKMYAKIGLSSNMETRFSAKNTKHSNLQHMETLATISTKDLAHASRVECLVKFLVDKYPAEVPKFGGHTETGSMDMIQEALEVFNRVGFWEGV